MKDKITISPRYRLQRNLTAAYALFICYVSLTPFSGWQSQGLSFIDVLIAPPGQTFTAFDFTLNCLSYFPFGFLLAYLLRGHLTISRALLLAGFTGLFFSVAMEYTQMFLPTRVSSNSDILSNSIGAFCGAAFAVFIRAHAWFSRIKELHHKWLMNTQGSDFGLTLLAMWIFAQINPSLPMLGSVFVGAVARWPFDIVPEQPFNWMGSAEVVLNVILIGILLSTLLRESRHTISALALLLSAVALAKFLAAALLLKSWALFLWLNSEAVSGMIAGWILLLAALRLSRNRLLVLGTAAAVVYFALMQSLLLDSTPSSALRLYHWHYVHMLNYNGLSQIVNLIFPGLLLVYLWRTNTPRK